MKSTLAFLIALFVVFPAVAQSEFAARVVVDSAFVRALPAYEADPAASVFENDSLIAVGRNIDGLWLQVRRPIGQQSLGWINREVISFTFEIGALPITDFETGLEGTEPVVDTGIAVLTLGEIAIRPLPDGTSPRLATTLAFLTLPVIDRTPDSQWLRVNYRGIVGWLPLYLINTSQDVEQAPVNPGYLASFAELPTIPPEIQLAQLERLIAFAQPLAAVANDAAAYWGALDAGQVLECRPLAGNYPYYTYTAQDITELPELRRVVDRLALAVDQLNASIAAMQRCGIYLDGEISSAYASAVNARLLFVNVIASMEQLRERILTVQPDAAVSP
ncbi:MAG: hypothetical protein IAE80_01400 [Anaerolinea sp.]|nr:hypothetical protein [Anaerolinea sp.]